MTLISNNRFLIRVCVSLLAGLVLYLPGQVYSLEIYTLIGDDCRTDTGLIVGGDERRIYMLNVDGGLSSIDQDSVQLALVYNIHDNPIRTCPFAKRSKAFRRRTNTIHRLAHQIYRSSNRIFRYRWKNTLGRS